MLKSVPLRVHPDEVIRMDVFAEHFHTSRSEILRVVVRLGIAALYETYKANPDEAEALIDNAQNMSGPSHE